MRNSAESTQVPLKSDFSNDYNCLFGFTKSMRIESESILFNNEKMELDERIRQCLSNSLKTTNFELKDLPKFYDSLEHGRNRSEELKEKAKKNTTNQFEYTLSYEKTPILEIEDVTNQKDWDEIWKGSGKLISNSHYEKGVITGVIFNEWATLKTDCKEPYLDDWKVAYDLLLLLGLRRRFLFMPNLGKRIFNIFLPVGRLKPLQRDDNLSDKKKKYQSDVPNFLVIPLLTLNAKPQFLTFRNTVAVSILLVPINEDFNSQSNISSKGIYRTNGKTKFELIDSPLKEFLENLKSSNIFKDDPIKLEKSGNTTELLEFFCNLFYNFITYRDDKGRLGKRKKICNEFEEEVKDQLLASNHITEYILMPSLNKEEVEKYYKGKINSKVHGELRSLVTPDQFIDDDKHFCVFPDVVDFDKMGLSDNARRDSDGLAFFNKDLSTIVSLLGKDRENVPYSSFKWGFAWFLYMSISMSLARALIYSAHSKIDSEPDEAKTLATIENSFIKGIEEFYDLDIKRSNYKEMYERMRTIDGLEKDFLILKDQISILKANLVLEEQRKVNKLIVLLTVVVVLIGILPWIGPIIQYFHL